VDHAGGVGQGREEDQQAEDGEEYKEFSGRAGSTPATAYREGASRKLCGMDWFHIWLSCDDLGGMVTPVFVVAHIRGAGRHISAE
jgi:hypothetical protein